MFLFELEKNSQLIVGTKSGSLMLYDVSSSTMISEVQAHSGAVWDLQLRPDGKGLVTGSADKDVKFWDFELVEVEDATQTVVDRLGNERKVCLFAFYFLFKQVEGRLTGLFFWGKKISSRIRCSV